MEKQELKNTLNMIQAYYRFLHIGSFLENYMKKNDLSGQVGSNLSLKTQDDKSFDIDDDMVQKFLKRINQNPNKSNIYGHIVQATVFRQIASNYRELIQRSGDFRGFLQNHLENQYLDFEQIIRFVRNVLSHSMNPFVKLHEDDYKKQKKYLSHHNTHKINFQFKYKNHLKKYWNGNKNHGFNIHLDFNKFEPGINFLELIDFHQLCMLCELCFYLGQVYKEKYLS